tara:strand:- start:355 stop:702 length:348 start_codon:yes stop_codon:yes gene_type:complete
MSETKEMLEATVKGLQDKIGSLNLELNHKQKELEDVNKPEITGKIYDSLQTCIIDGIEAGLNDLRVNDIDVEYGLDYDAKVYLESFNIPDDNLIQYVMGEINNKFKIIEDESKSK